MSCHEGPVAATSTVHSRRIALLGNPNAGKSTLFNALSGLNVKVANYPGVTVSKTVGSVKVMGQSLVVEDLPGCYSLEAISPDEEVVTASLDSTGPERPDALLVVMDATSLERSLGLLAQAEQLGLPVLAVLTFSDELIRRQGSVDPVKLSAAIGVPVMVVTGGNRVQLNDLKHALADVAHWTRPVIPAPADDGPQLRAWIVSVLQAADYRSAAVDDRTRRLDAVLLHPVLGTAIFVATMIVFFQVIFVVAAPIQDIIGSGVAWLAAVVKSHISVGWLASMLADGVISGAGSVLVFLPQIGLLFAMIALLESSGYLARVAFLMDRVMGYVGLEGRAFVAMLSALACAVPGIMSTRTLPSSRDRIATMMTAPLMTCSARLPVYTLLIAMLVPAEAHIGFLRLQGLVMFAMYLLGVAATMGAAWVFKRIFGAKGAALPFYMEMPSYRVPHISEILRAIWDACLGFVRRVGGIILILSLALWALLSLPVISAEQLNAAGVDASDQVAVATYQIDHSAAATLGRAVQPVVEPLGFDWRITVGLLGAMGAREVFVATLGQISSAEDPENPQANLAEMTWLSGPHEGQKLFTPPVIAALLVYFAFALQCTSTIAVLRKESGSWKWPALAFGYMTALAWIAAFVTKTLVGLLTG